LSNNLISKTDYFRKSFHKIDILFFGERCCRCCAPLSKQAATGKGLDKISVICGASTPAVQALTTAQKPLFNLNGRLNSIVFFVKLNSIGLLVCCLQPDLFPKEHISAKIISN